MTGGNFRRDDLLRARIVTHTDGTKILFSALNFEQYETWEELQSRSLEDRDYVISLLAALSSHEQANKASFLEWSDTKAIELARKYLRRFDRQDAAEEVTTFNQARLQIDAYIRGRLEGLTEITREGLKGFDNSYARITQTRNFDGGLTLANSLQNFGSLLRQNDLMAIAEMHQAQLRSLEELTSNVASSMMQHASIVEKMSASLGPIMDWATTFSTNFEHLYSGFYNSFVAQFPDLQEAIFEQRRADFLLEVRFQFLLDTAESWISDFATRFYENAADTSEAQVTKYLHKATSNEEFSVGLLELLSSTPKLRARRRAISAALDAHGSRNYLLSIPALLPQVEALTMHLLEKEGHVKWARQKRKWFETDPETGAPVQSRNGDRRFVSGLGHLSGIESRIVDNPIPEGLPLIRDEVARYRNDVLHGRVIRYDKPRESSRLVLLVFLLVTVLASDEEEPSFL